MTLVYPHTEIDVNKHKNVSSKAPIFTLSNLHIHQVI